MPYPNRGAWRFYNLDRSFEFWPRLDSISIVAEHPTGLATLDCNVALVGVNAAAVFDVEDECEATFNGEAIWRGHLKGRTEDSTVTQGPKVLVLSGHDYTAKLGDAIVRRRQKRKKETVRRRVKWLLKQLRSNIWVLAGTDLSGLPAGNPTVEAYDYYGMTVTEALDHVAAELRLFFYVDLDNVFHIFRNDLYAAPFGLDNSGSADLSTTFPFREWEYERDSTELANATLVEPEKRPDSRWTRDGTSVAAYGRQESFITDSSLGGPIAAGNVGARAIAEYADPTEEARLICWEPGLFPGQVVHITEDQWTHDFDRIVERVEIRAVDPHDDEGVAYLESTVTVVDRRRAKVGGGGGGGGGGNKGPNTTPKDQPVDTTPYPLDDFDRVVAPPTISDGAVIAGIALAGQMRLTRTHGETPVWLGPDWVAGANGEVGSYLGSWYNGHTSRPTWTACAGLNNAFTGYKEIETWYELVVSAYPGDAAGIKVTFEAGTPGGVQGPGYGEVAPIEVVASSVQPDDMRQGFVVGELMAGQSGTFTVPMGAVPTAGSKLYIGYRTKWEADAKNADFDYACGWTWPFMCNSYTLDNHGTEYAGHSGEVGQILPADATWQVWDAAAADLGSLPADPDAPWEGGNDWQDAGSEGEGDAWGMDGAAFYLTAEAPSGKGLTVVGNREDDDQAEGPWSDMGWAQEVWFTVDAHGDTAAAGTRHIESSTTGEGESTIGTVHLGDSGRDEGISVAGPTVVDYDAQALTLDTEWRARFDTRSGLYVRGKLWLASDGMPSKWNVQALLSQTDDDLDRWTLWLRGGNGAGFEQTIRVLHTRAMAGGVPGQRIVKELIGRSNGLENSFKTAHPFRPETLRAYVNGIGVAPSSADGAESSFGLDFWPTDRSAMRATYVIAE